MSTTSQLSSALSRAGGHVQTAIDLLERVNTYDARSAARVLRRRIRAYAGATRAEMRDGFVHVLPPRVRFDAVDACYAVLSRETVDFPEPLLPEQLEDELRRRMVHAPSDVRLIRAVSADDRTIAIYPPHQGSHDALMADAADPSPPIPSPTSSDAASRRAS